MHSSWILFKTPSSTSKSQLCTLVLHEGFTFWPIVITLQSFATWASLSAADRSSKNSLYCARHKPQVSHMKQRLCTWASLRHTHTHTHMKNKTNGMQKGQHVVKPQGSKGVQHNCTQSTNFLLKFCLNEFLHNSNTLYCLYSAWVTLGFLTWVTIFNTLAPLHYFNHSPAGRIRAFISHSPTRLSASCLSVPPDSSASGRRSCLRCTKMNECTAEFINI